MRIRRLSLLLVVTLTSVAGCGAESAEPTEHRRHAVIGGVESPPERDNVLYLRSTVERRNCTASLVAPNLILTARHCVSYFDDGRYACSTDGTVDENEPRDPSNAGSIGATVPPEDIEVYVGQLIEPEVLGYPVATGVRVTAPGTDTICRNDIALVQIEPELDLPVFPLRLYEGTFPRDPMLVVGYGQNETNAIDRHEREVEVLAVGQSDFYPVAGQATVRAFTVGQSVCPGDSGGPAITDRGAIAGVFSLINFDCMSARATNTYTQVAPYASIVESAFEQAGFEPVLEEPVGEGGGAGETGSTSSGGNGGSDGGTGGSGGDAASGGTGTGGTGGEADPPPKGSKDACYCRVGPSDRGETPWWAVAALAASAHFRRQSKKRQAQA